MLQPCSCTGSVAGVHGACLQQWIESRSHADPMRCELCNQRYNVVFQHHCVCDRAHLCTCALCGHGCEAVMMLFTLTCLVVMVRARSLMLAHTCAHSAADAVVGAVSCAGGGHPAVLLARGQARRRRRRRPHRRRVRLRRRDARQDPHALQARSVRRAASRRRLLQLRRGACMTSRLGVDVNRSVSGISDLHPEAMNA